jgi:uncharacterized protein YwgA
MNRIVELLRLIQTCEKVEGRKKLQKIVHLLKEAGFPFDYRYGFHYHGPFSAELKGEIDRLVAEGFLDEAASQPSSAEYRQYSYAVRPAAQAVLANSESARPGWSDVAKSLNAKSAQELEAISTVAYLRRHGYEAESLRDRFTQLKPQLSAYLDNALRTAMALVGK